MQILLSGLMRLSCLVIGYETNAHFTLYIRYILLVVFEYDYDMDSNCIDAYLVIYIFFGFAFIFSTNKSFSKCTLDKDDFKSFT